MAITAKEAIAATKDSKGFVTTIAKRLGCTRANVYALMKKYPTVKEAVDDEREMLKDFAEGKLFKQIDAENMTAIIFYLKTQAKDRGYVERTEVRNINLDVTELTDDELERIANGEDPIAVVGAKG